MSNDQNGGHPVQMGLVLLLLVGGGWYFFRHYDIDGLEGVAITPKAGSRLGRIEEPFTFTSSTEDGRYGTNRISHGFAGANAGSFANALLVADEESDPPIYSPSDMGTSSNIGNPTTIGNHGERAIGAQSISASQSNRFQQPARRALPRIRIASWALDGFGPTKLASQIARRNFVRVVRQFDVIALQQISSLELDLVPRMIDAINESSIGGGGPIYDYVLGPATGPPDRGEQLAILFNPERVLVDRTQTYTVADPDNQLMYDPLVAWFRASEPDSRSAWTFTLANVRIDLARAPAEVAILGQLLGSIQKDGRGEDDVVMAGLFQADDSYLMPTVAGPSIRASVMSTPTDIFGRHQTSNVLYDRDSTVEAIGSGGAYDFLRVYNLSLSEAQAVSSYLPVYAEFSPLEGSPLVHQAAGVQLTR